MPLKKFLHFEPITADELPAKDPLGNICVDCIFGSQQSLLCYKSGWDNCQGNDFEPRDKGFWGRVCSNLVNKNKDLEQKVKELEGQIATLNNQLDKCERSREILITDLSQCMYQNDLYDQENKNITEQLKQKVDS